MPCLFEWKESRNGIWTWLWFVKDSNMFFRAYLSWELYLLFLSPINKWRWLKSPFRFFSNRLNFSLGLPFSWWISTARHVTKWRMKRYLVLEIAQDNITKNHLKRFCFFGEGRPLCYSRKSLARLTEHFHPWEFVWSSFSERSHFSSQFGIWKGCRFYPPENETARTWTWMVGILISFWDSLFSGANC